jgi:hypothetical protein
VTPYLAVGPSIVIVSFDDPLLSQLSVDDEDTTIGADFRIGSMVPLTDAEKNRVSLFVEYRGLYVEPEFGFPGGTLEVESFTSSAIVGIAVDF